MYDPRALPDPGVAATISMAVFYVSLLADAAVTRYGVWYRGFVEKNPLIRNKHYDLTKTAGGTFIDGTIRTALLGLLAAGSDHFGCDKTWFWLMSSVAPVAMVVRNLLLIKKLPAKK